MHPKLRRQLRQRLVALDGRQGHLGFECRAVIASRSLHRRDPLVRPHSVALVKQGCHYHTGRISGARSLLRN